MSESTSEPKNVTEGTSQDTTQPQQDKDKQPQGKQGKGNKKNKADKTDKADKTATAVTAADSSNGDGNVTPVSSPANSNSPRPPKPRKNKAAITDKDGESSSAPAPSSPSIRSGGGDEGQEGQQPSSTGEAPSTPPTSKRNKRGKKPSEAAAAGASTAESGVDASTSGPSAAASAPASSSPPNSRRGRGSEQFPSRGGRGRGGRGGRGRGGRGGGAGGEEGTRERFASNQNNNNDGQEGRDTTTTTQDNNGWGAPPTAATSTGDGGWGEASNNDTSNPASSIPSGWATAAEQPAVSEPSSGEQTKKTSKPSRAPRSAGGEQTSGQPKNKEAIEDATVSPATDTATPSDSAAPKKRKPSKRNKNKDEEEISTVSASPNRNSRASSKERKEQTKRGPKNKSKNQSQNQNQESNQDAESRNTGDQTPSQDNVEADANASQGDSTAGPRSNSKRGPASKGKQDFKKKGASAGPPYNSETNAKDATSASGDSWGDSAPATTTTENSGWGDQSATENSGWGDQSASTATTTTTGRGYSSSRGSSRPPRGGRAGGSAANRGGSRGSTSAGANSNSWDAPPAPTNDEANTSDTPTAVKEEGWGEAPVVKGGNDGWGDSPVESSGGGTDVKWGEDTDSQPTRSWGGDTQSWGGDTQSYGGNGPQRFDRSSSGRGRGGGRFANDRGDARFGGGGGDARFGSGGGDARFGSGGGDVRFGGGRGGGGRRFQGSESDQSWDARQSNYQRGPRSENPRGPRSGSYSNQYGQPSDGQQHGSSEARGQFDKSARGNKSSKPREPRGFAPMFSDSLECQMTWKEMNLNPVVMASIARAGLEKPSNIQKMIMEPFQQGKDLIAQSQSQNDRTNTLAIALLQKLSSAALTQKHCQALVVCSDGVKPQKVHEDFQIWFKETPGLEAILLTTDMAKDTDKTSVLIDPEQPKQVVVTTLGPLLEAVRNNVLDMKAIGTVVISMRVAELVDFDSFKQFLGLLARDAQVILMTGRIEPKIQVIKDRHFRADAVVRRADELTMQWSEHYYVSIPSSSSPSSSSAVVGANEKEKEKEKGGEKEEEKEKEASDDKNQKVESTAPRDHKWEVLMQILTKNPNISHTVILTQSQSTTEALTAKLAAHKLPVLSAWSLADNTEVARQFNGPDPCILVSELTLMDNLDLDYSSLMINYEMSRRAAYYISSFGPFGRSGLRTLVINLCDPGQKQTLEDIESLYDIKIQEMQLD